MKVLFVLLITVACITAVPDGDCPQYESLTPIYLADTEECAVFYECANNRPYKFFCAPGTYWNPANTACSMGVNCGNRRTTHVATITKAPRHWN